jgi:predicted lipoprotein with Yx(FWY)xxD motif
MADKSASSLSRSARRVQVTTPALYERQPRRDLANREIVRRIRHVSSDVPLKENPMSRRLVLVSIAVVSLAACGSSTTTTATTAVVDTSVTTTVASAATTGAPPDTTLAAPATTVAAPAASGSLALADTKLGKILVAANGMTVYLYTKDTSATASACTGGCATAWPPVTGPVTAGAGVDSASITSLTGPNGEQQVAYKGHPLYYFARDSAAGDTLGHKVGGVWFVLDASGAAITS